MPLQLTGSKTLQIAGTPLQCVEIYTGESYVIPFQFTSGTPPNPINITGWTLTTNAKWYTILTNSITNTNVDISSIELIDPQPNQPAGLTAVANAPTQGAGYIYLPTSLTPEGYSFPLTANPILLCIVTLQIERVDPVSSLNAINREPIGILIRYQ